MISKKLIELNAKLICKIMNLSLHFCEIILSKEYYGVTASSYCIIVYFIYPFKKVTWSAWFSMGIGNQMLQLKIILVYTVVNHVVFVNYRIHVCQ